MKNKNLFKGTVLESLVESIFFLPLIFAIVNSFSLSIVDRVGVGFSIWIFAFGLTLTTTRIYRIKDYLENEKQTSRRSN